jgi:hypothetical protein
LAAGKNARVEATCGAATETVVPGTAIKHPTPDAHPPEGIE